MKLYTNKILNLHFTKITYHIDNEHSKRCNAMIKKRC